MPRKSLVLGLLCLMLVGLHHEVAEAHWCSNIFVTRARIIVKPEKTTINLSSTPTDLRVYLQNNFPYKIIAYMRGSNSGYVYPTTPSSGYTTVYPGQKVSFIFSLTGSGTTQVSTLNLQMKFRTTGTTSASSWTWRNDTNSIVNQTPTQSSLISGTTNYQSGTLSAAKLAELYPSATLPASSRYVGGRTGIQQLIHWFGYRFCYNTSGYVLTTSCTCPATSCPQGSSWTSIDQFAQNVMRAGAEIAAQKSTLGSNLASARAAATNALTGGGSMQHKCLAAVVGGYLYQGASSSAFTSALSNSSNSVPTACQNAGLRALNGSNASNCSSGQYYERAACAAAEGLRNNNTPVTSILMPYSGDGMTPSTGYTGLYYAYMLYIVQAYRKATTGYVPFYPDAGSSACTGNPDCDDSNDCTTDSCNTSTGSCTNTPISNCCTSSSQCNDNNACTTDSCNTSSHTCTNTTISGCCTSNAQCSDSNVCTTDTCNTSSNTCAYAPISNCCTSSGQCNDSNACTTDTCNTSSNTCAYTPISSCCTTSSQCNDNDVCTSDSCNTSSHTCSNPTISGCCTSNSQCGDSNVCTSDVCSTSSNTCSNNTISGCCTANSQCSDSNSCTTDSCNTTSNTCVYTPISNCCTSNSQCNDSNVCTTDTCNTSTGVCSNATQSGCCTVDTECADTNVCTLDTCSSNTCSNTAITGCCTSASQCNDSNACTTDTCNSSNSCVYTPISSCCTANSQCNDNKPCTTDTCVSNSCQNTAIASCCTTNSQCADTNVCTTDTCVSNACQNTVKTGCCTTSGQCNDSKVCTTDSCNTTTNTCVYTPQSGCCTTNAQCSDNNVCTTDTCSSNKCVYTALSGCCKTDATCADNNPCTTDKCNTTTGKCSNTKLASCCAVDTDCDDKDSCTLDKCDTTTNKCTNTKIPCGDGGMPDAGAGDLSTSQETGSSVPDQGNTNNNSPTLEGGCAVGGFPAGSAAPLGLLILSLLFLRRRRNKK